MKYFFRLGKTPNLSIAEIQSLFELEVLFFSRDVLIVESSAEKFNIDQLGGSIKVGIVLDEVNSIDEVKNLVVNDLALVDGRKVFGLTSLSSVYGRERLERLGMEIKNEFDSARYVTSKDKELSSVIVTKEKLLAKGGDYYLIEAGETVFLGKTTAVQDFESYDHRDFDRPKADSKSGMLPPKLAQIMINLTQENAPKSEKVLLDPFCGSGTILQEALLLGYKKVIGCDKSEKAIDDTTANLEWLEKEYKVNLDEVCLNHLPVEDLLEQITAVDLVVTEPYLGPPLKGGEKREEILKNINVLEKLFIESFKKYSQILPNAGKVVTVVPAFRFKNEILYLDIFEKIKDLGFTINFDYLDIEKKGLRYPLVYAREDQKVIREIIVAKLTK